MYLWVGFALGYIMALVILSVLRASQTADFEQTVASLEAENAQLRRENEELRRQLYNVRELAKAKL